MHTLTRIGVPLALVAALAACASVPSGPSMLVLPGTGKSFDQFRGDDAMCRQYAQQQTGASPQEVADASGVRSAALGTAIGAVAGAAVGGSRGAAVGAGGGLLVGSASGAGAVVAGSAVDVEALLPAFQQFAGDGLRVLRDKESSLGDAG